MSPAGGHHGPPAVGHAPSYTYQYPPPALPLSASTIQNLSTLPVFTLDDFHAASKRHERKQALGAKPKRKKTPQTKSSYATFDKIKAGKLVGDAVIGDVIPVVGTRLPLHEETSTGDMVDLLDDEDGSWDGYPDYALSKLGGLRLWPGDQISFEGAWFEPR